MRSLTLTLCAFGAILANARPAPDSRSFKQATRADVVRRASRPHAKKATISGNAIPSSNNHYTFVMQAQGSGFSATDGKYAVNVVANIPQFSSSSTDGAATYYLDSDGYLYNSNGNVGYADPGSPGSTYVYFEAPGPQDISYGAAMVQCTIDGSSLLSCTAGTLSTLKVCDPSLGNGRLGFNTGSSNSCYSVNVYAYTATP